MKKRIHLICATAGLVCAAGFAIVPFASADAGPLAKVGRTAVSAPATASNTSGMTRTAVKKRMNRKNVAAADAGCGG